MKFQLHTEVILPSRNESYQVRRVLCPSPPLSALCLVRHATIILQLLNTHCGQIIQAPPRKRRLVTYYMQPLSEQAGYAGPRKDGHRFGVNRILRLGDENLLSAGRDGIVRRWDVSPVLAGGGGSGAERPGGAC